MKIAVVFTAVRIIDNAGSPQEGQTEAEFLQCYKESTIQDPFSFLDVPFEQIEVACSVAKVAD